MIRRKLKTRSTDSGMWTVIDSLQAGLSGTPAGYTRLSKCPEVIMAVERIADLVSNMSLHLMENTENGDVRVENGLSRKLDISPCTGMTRKSWMSFIVRTLLLEGDGNAVVLPVYDSDGFIQDLIPVPAKDFNFNLGRTFKDGYEVQINNKKYKPDEVIHFITSPDPDKLWIGRGHRIPLKKLTSILGAGQDAKEQFMNGRYMPSVIIQVDSDVDDLSSAEGKEKIFGKFVKSTVAGEPWVIPSELVQIEQVKPLSLKDIAVTETIAQDKKTLAALLGVPAFLIGEGEFDKDEYNNFIKDKILSVAKSIEQTLTERLLIRDDWYFRFNIRSLYSNDLEALSNVGDKLYSHGIMTGNEVRDWMGLSPMEGLDELIILENYIPADRVGDQKKLNGETSDEGV